ncbi:MAG: M56 family metallopeptidase, partial [Pirellulales bacterium]
MTLQTICDPTVSGRLCLTLVHSVWQVALFAAIAWGLDRLWRRRSVEGSYALHVAAILAGLAAMPITYALVDADWSRIAAQSEATVAVAPPPAPTEVLKSGGPLSVASQAEQSPNVRSLPSDRNTVASAPVSVPLPAAAEEAPPVWPWIAPWIVSLYTVGVLLMLLRLIRGMWLAQQLASKAQLIGDGALVDGLTSLARGWSMRIVPALVRAEEIVVPKVVGLVRPTILLPVSAITCLSPEELAMILAHELAHVRRYDMWVNLVQRVAEVALFFNPALWYLSRRASTLREYCCDELTCRAMSGSDAELRTRYASALLRIVELGRQSAARRVHARTIESGDLAALAAAGRSPSDLRRRIARLFGEPLHEPVRLSRGGVLTLAVLAATLLAAPKTWYSTADSAAAQMARTIGDNAAPSNATPPAVPGENSSGVGSVEAHGKQINDQPGERVDLAIVVARHVILRDGKKIMTWSELEKVIAALPDPSQAEPQFYITRGAQEAGRYESAKKEIWRLRRDYRLRGHSEGSLWRGADLRYDQIETAADLVPDESLRVEGQVLGKGEPVAGAEVLLLTPVDESFRNDSFQVDLVNGRLGNPLDYVMAMTHSDERGQFALYPPKDTEYYVVALHPEAGIGLVPKKRFSDSGKVGLGDWATLTIGLDKPAAQREDASLSMQGLSLCTRVLKGDAGGFAEIVFYQEMSDQNKESATGVFRFTHVPPMVETTIRRVFAGDDQGIRFGLADAKVSLLRGESRRLGLGPLSVQQSDLLEEVREGSRSGPPTYQKPMARTTGDAGAQSPAEVHPVAPNDEQTPRSEERREATVEVFVAMPDGKPVSDAEVLACGRASEYGYGSYRTDAKGRVSIPWKNAVLGRAMFRLVARHGDALGWHGRQLTPDIADGASKQAIRITLYPRSQTIEGTCVDPNGQPLSGVSVRV